MHTCMYVCARALFLFCFLIQENLVAPRLRVRARPVFCVLTSVWDSAGSGRGVFCALTSVKDSAGSVRVGTSFRVRTRFRDAVRMRERRTFATRLPLSLSFFCGQFVLHPFVSKRCCFPPRLENLQHTHTHTHTHTMRHEIVRVTPTLNPNLPVVRVADVKMFCFVAVLPVKL